MLRQIRTFFNFAVMDIPALLKLRLLQAFRILKEVGPILILLLLFVSIAFISQFIGLLWEIAFPQALILGITLLAGIHFSRKDLRFLKLCASSNLQLKKIFLFEYLLIVLPFSIIALLGQNIWGALGLCCSTALSFILPIDKNRGLPLSWNVALKWVPLSLFELRALIRKRWLVLLFFYLIGYLSFLHIAAFYISIIGCALFISSAFEWIEPKELIHWKKNFLTQKILINLRFLFILFSPVFLLALVFHLPQFYHMLIGMLVIVLIVVFSVLYKYAMYQPQTSRLPQSIIHALFFLFLIIPGFQLVSILLCFWYARKAKKNMTYFWDEKLKDHAPN